MTLGALDMAVLAAYFVAVIVIGAWFGRREHTTHDFFLGGRTQHWFIVGLSIIATEVSAITFVAVPADSFRGDWNYLQLYAGSLLGRFLIVVLLLPAFYRESVTTVYEYLGRRFGPWTRTTGALLFFASRVIGSGFRLLIASLAIAVLFYWPLPWVILGTAGIAIAYTTFGGIKAIIWTDAFQAFVFIGGGIAAVVFLLMAIPGPPQEAIADAWHANRFHTFTWTGGLNYDKLFWVLLIHSTFNTMAALGTDQDLTQRMLTCPDLARGRRSLIFNALAGFPIVCLFLLLGTLLSLFYASGNATLPDSVLKNTDQIFPHFIAHGVPTGYGLRGLLIAGVFAAAMSSLDSALGALSSSAVTDFYRPYLACDRTDRHYVWVARVFVLIFGIVLAGVALAFIGHDEILWEVFRWSGLIFGALLGVFLLAVLTKRRGHDRFNVFAMLSSVAVLVTLKLVQERGGPDQPNTVWIAWPWWVVLGTVWTFVLASLCRTKTSHEVDAVSTPTRLVR